MASRIPQQIRRTLEQDFEELYGDDKFLLAVLVHHLPSLASKLKMHGFGTAPFNEIATLVGTALVGLRDLAVRAAEGDDTATAELHRIGRQANPKSLTPLTDAARFVGTDVTSVAFALRDAIENCIEMATHADDELRAAWVKGDKERASLLAVVFDMVWRRSTFGVVDGVGDVGLVLPGGKQHVPRTKRILRWRKAINDVLTKEKHESTEKLAERLVCACLIAGGVPRPSRFFDNKNRNKRRLAGNGHSN